MFSKKSNNLNSSKWNVVYKILKWNNYCCVSAGSFVKLSEPKFLFEVKTLQAGTILELEIISTGI